jgi:hypothetical protein
MNIYLEMYHENREAAEQAYALFVKHCEGIPPCRAPGMDTVIRLASRIGFGRSIEEAAAREYCYRWSLALKSPIFGVPHALGL